MAQSLDATFFAFRKRTRGGVLTGLSIAYLVIALVLLASFVAVNFSAIGAFVSWYGELLSASVSGDPSAAYATAPPEGVMTLLATLLPYLFAFYLLLAAYEAGCLRWMIRGETEGLMGLSLGADTWRVYSSYWVWFGLYIAYALLAGIVMAALIFGLAMAAADQPGLMIAGTVIGYLLYYAVMLYFAVRLAPAAAVSVGRRKFSFFSAWTVTRGRFWALFGAFLLLIILVIVIQAVLAGVFGAIVLGGVGPSLANGDPSMLIQTLAAPQNLIILGVGYALLIALSLVVYVAFYGVNARAVLAAAEEGKIDGVAVAATSAPPA